MNQNQVDIIIRLLKEIEVSFDRGLSHEEVCKIEQFFNFNFPPDLKLFLQTALPISDGFAHWRFAINSERGRKEIQNKIIQPFEGILFDVKNSDFWMPSWGEKPELFITQKEIVAQHYLSYPTLIPIYLHRYMSAEPMALGNPVFSVYQTDVIYYGFDLADYFVYEFGITLPSHFGQTPQPYHIEFWSTLAESK